jgi:hypothetical protein
VLLRNNKLTIILGIAIVLLVAVCFTKSSPMTEAEVGEYLEKIAAFSHEPGGRHDMQQLRAFFNADDGEAFYTVNLYKFHDNAHYLKDEKAPVTGSEAYDKFSSVMVKLLLSNASYPVFGSTWVGLSEKGWDRLVIVRYSSRRAMAEIFSDPKFSMASEHKWASISQHERFVVKALHLPEMYMLLGLLIAIFLSVLLSNNRLFSRKSNV